MARDIRPYKPRIHDPDDIVEVPEAIDMEDEQFIRHLELRHAKECKIEGYMHRHNIPVWINMYRVFHERLHALAAPGQHDHEHVEDEE